MTTVVVTARVAVGVADELAALAAKLKRSRAWIAQQAIERYVKEESEFLAFVQVGIDAADRGELYTQEEVEEWFVTKSRPAAAE